MNANNNSTQNLDVLFVYPSYGNITAKEKLRPARISDDIPNQESPHIGIGYLLAVAKKSGIRAKFIDMVFDNFSVDDLIAYVKEHRPALVGFTAFTTHIKSAGYLAEMIKSSVPNTKVCAGGPHVSAIPAVTLEEFPAFDFVICGEAEETLAKILDCLDNEEALGKIIGVATRGSASFTWAGCDDLDALSFPAWEEFDLSKYGGLYPHQTGRELPMLAQRGCPYKCNFCMRASGDDVRSRSVGSVISEIEHNIEAFGCGAIAFLDETFTLNKKWTRDFFATLKKRGLNDKIKWACSMRVSHTTPELFTAMREAGCYYTFFGLESADPKVLEIVDKKIDIDDMRRSVNWAKEAGIVPVGAFIIGLAEDTEETVHKAIDLAGDLDLFSITFPIAVPFPGTELRQQAEQNQFGLRILSNNWNQYGKQEGGVMESEALSWSRRKELQQIAYERHPKKNLDAYIRNLAGAN